ncbi:MAG TPA: hypothetical protein VLT83_16105 [Opitutaceae bacterium]|nr:hypothetical protein [Opitutaceae bacterium]
MKSLRLITAALAAVLLTSALALAGDPTGSWKWSFPGRDGQSREITLKLELKDGQLTGSVSGFRGETPISNASCKDDQIVFSVVREFQGNKFETKYTGKLEGDTIKGTIERTGRDGQATTNEWTATRAK